LAAERLGSGKQFVEVENTQQTGAPESRIVDRVGSGKGAGMRGRRARSLLMAARLDHDDRLDAGGGPRGRHEFLRSADRFDIEQNGAGHPVGGEMVEAIGEIDIRPIAEGDGRRQADAAAHGPFDERGGDRAGLRHESEVARRGGVRGEASVEPRMRRHHAEAIGPD
jgi:hypothetical protein